MYMYIEMCVYMNLHVRHINRGLSTNHTEFKSRNQNKKHALKNCSIHANFVASDKFLQH